VALSFRKALFKGNQQTKNSSTQIRAFPSTLSNITLLPTHSSHFACTRKFRPLPSAHVRRTRIRPPLPKRSQRALLRRIPPRRALRRGILPRRALLRGIPPPRRVLSLLPRAARRVRTRPRRSFCLLLKISSIAPPSTTRMFRT
jgi:hypothetical protein